MIDQLMEWAKIDSTWDLLLVGFGLVAQGIFFGRWLVQWFVSEKHGESRIPVAFWWMSLAGAGMTWVYFLLRGEVVGVIAQSTGWIIYSRNLWLIYRERWQTTHPSAPAGDDADVTPAIDS